MKLSTINYFLATLLLIVLYAVVFALGCDRGGNMLRRQAVEHGCAHWEVEDQRDPHLVFKWGYAA